MTRSSNRVYGPLVSTSDAAAHVRLFTHVFGMVVVATDVVLAPDVVAAFAPDGGVESLRMTVLRTPGTDSGVVLLATPSHSPGAEETVRDWSTRVDRDALKVIDFYAPDFQGAIAHARAQGYEVIESEASYELAEGAFTEAHLWGPDNVVTAFLGGPAEFFGDFAQVTHAHVSEVQSISAPLSDAGPSVAFYRDVLGWDVVYEYAIDDPSFAEMLGVDSLQLRSRNMGPSTREPYFGLIDYGLDGDHQGSLRGRSALPRRGLLGAVVLSDDLDAVALASGTTHPVVPFVVDPLETSRALWLDTPHSVPHLVLEVRNARGSHPRPEEGTSPC